MSRLLADLACPRSLVECRALLRGVVAAQRTPLPSVVVRELFDGREPKFRNLAQADQFVASLFALQSELHERFAGAAWSEEGTATRERLVGSLEDRALLRYAEVRSFLRGLDLGATNPADLDDAGRAALKCLTGASAYLGAISGLAKTDAPSQAELAALTESHLAQLEDTTRASMLELEASLRAGRAPDGSRPPGTGVGPNDLCACGSGKPLRRCCGGPA